MKALLEKLRNNIAVFFPLLAFPVLFLPYCIINGKVLVKVFGCGCVEGFNANRITEMFWSVVAVFASLFTAFRTKKLEKWRDRVFFTVLAVAVSLLLGYWFTRSMLWA